MARGMKDKIMGEHDFTSYSVILWENENGMYREVTEEVGWTLLEKDVI